MPRSFDRFFGSTVDHPWVVVSIIVLLTGISVIGHLGPESVWETVSPVFFSTSSTPAEPLPEPVESGTSEDRVTTQVDPVSVTDSDTILVIRSDDFFTPSGAEALREIVAALEELEYVDDVFWMDTVPVLNIFGLRESLFPRATASPRQFEMARRNALKHPLVRGQLLSDDGRTLLMMIRFDWLFVESDEAVTTKIRETANRITARFPEVSFETMITGRVPIYLTYMKAQETNRRFFQMVGYSTVALLAIILFRGIRAVMIVGLAPVLGVLWTMGMLRYFDVRDNPFNDIVLPILLALVGLTDGVHLMVEIRKLRASGLGEKAAARAGIRKVGFACFLTSLTTAIGFGSLSLAHHQVIQEFGWSCVLGVILTFVAVITAIPLACSTWLGRNIHVGLERGLIDRHLHRISGIIQVSLHSPRIMSLAAILITAGLVAVSLTLRPDEHQANALPAKSEAYRAIKHMDLAMGGLEPGFVTIRWDDKIRQNPGMILKVITIADEILEREELIGHPLSLADFLKALPGEGTYEQRMSLAELLPPPLKLAFYQPENNLSEINFRVQDLGIARYGPVFQRVESELRRMEADYPGFELRLHGPAVRRWRDLYQIVVDLALSLGSATGIIFLVLMLAYRSIRLGLIALVPNLFPLAVTGTYLVVTGQSLEIASVCAFTVCLGIAVDDTIHFLTRYREEHAQFGTRAAIEKAFTGTGTALVMTTLVLCVGFATVLFSDMRDQRIFSTMGGLTIASALLGDLLFLPAMLATFDFHPGADPANDLDSRENQETS